VTSIITPREAAVRRGIPLAVLMLAASAAWLGAFPPDSRRDWSDITTEASYLVAGSVAYVFIARLRVPILELGWVIFLFSLLFEVLDEFTIEGRFWSDTLTAAMAVPALVMVAFGFRQAVRSLDRADAERRAGEAATVRAKEAAEAANVTLRETIRQKDDVVSIVAHDFRSPLTVIQGFSELMHARSADPETRALLDAIGVQARYLTSLADDVLTMTRIESGTMPLDAREVDLAEVARDAIAARATSPSPEVVLHATAGASPIRGDARRLRQVIENLIDNAVKYAPSGTRVTVSVQGAPGAAMVSVADSGPGIAPEEVAGLFQKFSRLAAARRSGVHGTGLGLYICRSIVEAHGGSITVDTAPGKGSVFKVVLPTVADVAPLPFAAGASEG
jgi:signal transduction histidine kinase